MAKSTTQNLNTAAHIRRARKGAGLSLAQAEELTTIERNQLEAYELPHYDHRIYFPPEHSKLLAAVYGVSHDYLCGGQPQTVGDHLAEGMPEKELLAWVRQQATGVSEVSND